MPLQKEYNIKIYNQDGTTFVTSVSGAQIANEIQFSSKLNGGFGQCILEFVGDDYKFDSFGEGTTIDFMNIVKIYAVSANNPTGTLIYVGYMSKYEPFIEIGGREGCKVTLLHVSTLLSKSFYKNGSSYTVTHTSDDAETIGRAIITHFNTIFGGSLLSYTDATTDAVGTNVDITFTDQKWFDALKKTGELAGNDWWWKIDEQGQYWLKDKPASSTHTFMVGRHIDSIIAPKDSEKIYNDLQVRRSGGTTSDYSDATSQGTYGTGSTPAGKYSKIISDTSLTSADAADRRGNKFINDNKDAKIKATLMINNEYDLETISVGETCDVRNYSKDSSFFDDNMMIASIMYMGNNVKIDLLEEPSAFMDEMDEFVNPTT